MLNSGSTYGFVDTGERRQGLIVYAYDPDRDFTKGRVSFGAVGEWLVWTSQGRVSLGVVGERLDWTSQGRVSLGVVGERLGCGSRLRNGGG